MRVSLVRRCGVARCSALGGVRRAGLGALRSMRSMAAARGAWEIGAKTNAAASVRCSLARAACTRSAACRHSISRVRWSRRCPQCSVRGSDKAAGVARADRTHSATHDNSAAPRLQMPSPSPSLSAVSASPSPPVSPVPHAAITVSATSRGRLLRAHLPPIPSSSPPRLADGMEDTPRKPTDLPELTEQEVAAGMEARMAAATTSVLAAAVPSAVPAKPATAAAAAPPAALVHPEKPESDYKLALHSMRGLTMRRPGCSRCRSLPCCCLCVQRHSGPRDALPLAMRISDAPLAPLLAAAIHLRRAARTAGCERATILTADASDRSQRRHAMQWHLRSTEFSLSVAHRLCMLFLHAAGHPPDCLAPAFSAAAPDRLTRDARWRDSAAVAGLHSALNNKWIHFSGDSTLRDTYYQLVALLEHSPTFGRTLTDPAVIALRQAIRHAPQSHTVRAGSGSALTTIRLSFAWSPYVHNVTANLVSELSSPTSSAAAPDLVVMSSGLWHVLYDPATTDRASYLASQASSLSEQLLSHGWQLRPAVRKTRLQRVESEPPVMRLIGSEGKANGYEDWQPTV